MANHGSAIEREETLHVSNSTTSRALQRRAQSLINNKSIDAQSRIVIRYALEIKDPWLADLVGCAEAGKPVIDHSTGLIAREIPVS